MLTHNFIFIFAFIILNALSVFAGPGKTTYQAKIVKPDGYPLEVSSVNFKFTILDPAGSCVLYSETYSSVNMSSTGGLISFALGSGVKTYPASATTFEQVFSNIAPSLSCDTGGPVSYSPSANDIRKIVMQFHDGSGWQTLPAMSINAVPYAMYANEATKLNGLTSSDFVQVSTVPTCTASEALRYTGASFTCVAVGNSVTSSTVVTALGYTPADSVSLTTVTSNVSSVSSTVFSVSSTVTSLQNSVAASFAAITSSQWTTSGTNIFYNTGNIGVGTTTPVTKLDVSGGVRIGLESTTCAPALAGTLRYNASNVEYCNGTSWQAFGVSGSGITNINGSTSGTQSLATGTGGTAPNIATANGVHTLNIPNAATGSVTGGLISNADYTTFSNKITSSAASIAQVLGYTPANSATTVSSQWNTSGTTINYMNGNVGIGTTTPAQTTEIDGSWGFNNSSPQISGTTQKGILRLGANSGANGEVLDFGFNVNSSSGYAWIQSTNRSNLAINYNLTFNPNGGNIGVGTTTPVTKLDVSGGVRIGTESTTCAPALAGTLRYNASNVEYCNGTSWQAFGVSGAGITNINGSTSGTQSFTTGTGGTAPNIATANGVHTLNIPNAATGSVTGGLISNVDYTTFSNKITSSAASIAQVLGYVPADNAASGTYAQKTNNLSDLTNVATARTNLGLGTFATANTLDLGSASATGTLAIARLPSFTGDATIAAASNTIILSNSGVTAGTYTKVTVDSKGRVTSSSALAVSDVTTALGYTPASATASTQWTTSGAAIYYNTGNVGIGTGIPSEKLSVAGNLNLVNPGATINRYMNIAVNGGAEKAFIRFDQTASPGPSQYWDVGSLSASNIYDFGFESSGTRRMTLTFSGNLGVGTSTPMTKLDIAGGVRISMEAASCTASYAGTLRYTGGNIEYCNGSSWAAFGIATAGVNSLNGSTSQTQTFANGTTGTAPAFVTANGVHTLNIPLASAGLVTGGLLSNADYTTFMNQITSSAASISQVLGYAPVSTTTLGNYVLKANNLSDLTSSATARTNLGLGTFATASSIDLGSASATGTMAAARMPELQGDVDSVSGSVITTVVGLQGRSVASTAPASGQVLAYNGTSWAPGTSISSQWSTSGSTINYSSGNVGIGTTGPINLLHAHASAGNTVFRMSNASTGTTGGDGFVVQQTATDVNFINYETGAMAFQTSASERMRITSSGAVGIGTTTPTAPLDVANNSATFSIYSIGKIGVKGTSSCSSGTPGTCVGLYGENTSGTGAGVYGIASTNNAGTVGVYATATGATNAAYALQVVNNSTTGWGIYSSGSSPNYFAGNVGVGTTQPTARLHITAGTSSVAGIKLTSGTLLSSPQSGTIEYDGTDFYLTDGNNNRRTIATTSTAGTLDNVTVVSSPSGIALWPAAGNSVTVSATTASTNSSTGALIVKGGMGIAGNLYSSGTIITSSNIQGASITATSALIAPYIYGSTAVSGDLYINSTTHATKGNLILMDQGGKVGIGTTSPLTPLHVKGEIASYEPTFGRYLKFEPTSAGVQYLSVNYGLLGASYTSELGFKVDGSEKMRILSNGNVGVGTTGPTAKLHVRQAASEQPFSVDKSDGTNIMNVDWAGRITMDTNVNSSVPMLTVGNGNFGGRLLVLNGKSNNTNNLFEAKHNSVDKFVITYTGATGIGTSNPTTALHIVSSGTGTARGLRINSTGTGNGVFAEAQFATDAREFRLGVGSAGESTYGVPGKFYLFDNNANAMRMVVDTSGNVGIGTATPNSTLEVSGVLTATKISGVIASIDNRAVVDTPETFSTAGMSLNFKNNSANSLADGGLYNGVFTFRSYGNTTDWSGGPAHQLGFTINGNIYHRYGSNTTWNTWRRIIETDNAGNVGIGTTSPTTPLHVVSAGVTGWNSIIKVETTAANAHPLIMYRHGGADTGYVGFGDGAGTNGFGVYNYLNADLTLGTSSTTMMTFKPSGNIGIGTTSPSYRFQVNKISSAPAMMIGGANAGSPRLQVYGLESDSNAWMGLGTDMGGNIYEHSIYFPTGPSNNGRLTLGDYNGTTYNTRMTVLQNGNVGIGTTAPITTLHVAGTGYVRDSGNSLIELLSRSDSAFNVTNNSTTKRGFSLHHENSSALMAQWYHCPSGVCTQKLSFDYAGNMVIAGTLTQSSDIRLKKNIVPLQSSLDKILNLNGVSYYWKDKEVPGKQMGLIAQEVEKVFPEIIKKDEKGFLSVGYQNLVAPLIESVKELYRRLVGVEQQQRQMASMVETKADKSEVEKLKAENAALKAYICSKDPSAPICK